MPLFLRCLTLLCIASPKAHAAFDVFSMAALLYHCCVKPEIAQFNMAMHEVGKRVGLSDNPACPFNMMFRCDVIECAFCCEFCRRQHKLATKNAFKHIATKSHREWTRRVIG